LRFFFLDSEMNPWFAKAVVLLANLAMVIIRAPHGQRSRTTPVAKSRQSSVEVILLTFAWVTFFLALIWIITPVFDFADYPLHPIPLITGVALLVIGLWLFHRSHADLGTNWSITLEVREHHRLVTHGVYRWVRHPMYLALLIFAVGQMLALPNWLVGPSYLVAMFLITAFRLGPEERMMLETFGKDFEAYKERTRRLIPGVW
jgi:protein-S-isoprenylcysteine O-methyltransferase Ste14